MTALIRKNIRAWGYIKAIALFIGCLVFSVSGRVNGAAYYELHILSAVSDHYYLTYFLLPMVLLSSFSFLDDDDALVILRFQSYHSYFLRKWLGVGLIALLLTAIQTGAILLSGIGLPLGKQWGFAVGATGKELFSVLQQLFSNPLQAFLGVTLYQLVGSWLIFGICMWIGHFAGKKWTVRIIVALYILSAVWIKIPAIQTLPLTSFNHLLILHHNLGVPERFKMTGFSLLILALIIIVSIRFAWRGRLPHFRFCRHGIADYYLRNLMTKRNILILLAVVSGITLYKRLGYGSVEASMEWVYTLFAGHGTGYFRVLPFLELLITNGTPIYLLAVFVEHIVSGQSMFISARAKSRKNLLAGILFVSTKFLATYTLMWLLAGFIGAVLFGSGITMSAIRLLLYAVLIKCLDILLQYLIMLSIYLFTKQITVGFLVLIAGNLFCILPMAWVSYLPIGLSSLVRISLLDSGMGILPAPALGIEISLSVLIVAGLAKFGDKKILN